MELLKALEILAKLADLSQSKGILNLDEAVIVKQAKDTALMAIQEIRKENEKVSSAELKKVEDNSIDPPKKTK